MEPRDAHAEAEQAFAELLQRSSLVDWVYGAFSVTCLLLAAVSLLRPQTFMLPMAPPLVGGGVALFGWFMSRRPFGRSSRGLVTYFLLVYALVVALGHVNGLGLRTPTLTVGPLFLFILACITPRPMALFGCGVGMAMSLSLVPVTPVVVAPGSPTLMAEVLSMLISLFLGSVLGIAIGRVLRRSIAESARAAQVHYRSVYGDEALRTLRSVVQASPYGMVMSELATGRIRLFNAAFARIVGRSEADIENQTGPGLGAWADLEQRQRIIERVQRGEVVDDVIALRRSDQTIRRVRGSATLVELDGTPHMLVVGRDISDEYRRQVELQAVIDTAEAAILVVQRRRIIIASRRYEALMRLAPGTAAGRDAALDIGGLAHLEALEAAHLPALKRSEAIAFEHTAHRADGSTFEARFTGRLIAHGADDGFRTVFLIEDITELKAQVQQLDKARADALAASRAKTKFLAMMSHEIRTPLNGVMGLAELAADPQTPADAQREYLRLMVDSGRSLLQVISDVLDISKIEAGQLPLQPEDFDLAHWLEGIRTAFVWSVESKGLQLLVERPPEPLGWVRADPTRLRQIAVNYLSNALKFTFQGQIRLRLSFSAPTRLRLEVSDTGMGIDEARQQRLFRPFEQGGVPVARYGGTGLGLSICRDLAQRMNGQVGVHSVPGAGSTFWAEVEVQPAASPHREASASRQATQPLHGLRVLLADDNRINRLVGVKLLQRAGAQVHTADDGQQAVDAVEQAHARGEPFDAVLMDLQMPVMDGVQATRLIRQQPAHQGLVILAATAAVTQEELSQALDQGMDGAISKPFDSTRLVSALLESRRRMTVPRSGAELAH